MSFKLSKIKTNKRYFQEFLHDISSPLTLIQYNLDVLSTKIDPNQQQEIFNLLANTVLSIEQVNKLISTVKQEISSRLEKRNFEIGQEIEACIKMFESELEQDQIHVDFTSSQKITLFNNPTIFHKIFINLLINAVEAVILSQKQKKEIILKIAERNNNVYVQIKDNGIGMSQRQLKDMHSYKINGKGKGLFIVKNCLRQYFNGDLICHSKVGIGTAFTIKMPII